MAATQQRRRPPKANPKATIQDWLNLVDPDGAFMTTTELLAVFPNGFDPMPTELRTELRARTAELTDDPVERADLREWLLGTVLDWDDLLADGQRIPTAATVRTADGVELRPEHVLLDTDDANRVRLGVFVWPDGTALDRRADATTTGDSWTASPLQRAETWCRESGTPLALVTDDDHWVLVWAPRGAPSASGRWSIGDLADERVLQAGFVSLLGARRFFSVSDEPKTGETIERLFERAADAEAEVTKGLGSSVRQSVELLVAAMSRDDVASGGAVLRGIPNTEVYEASVTVLMRLVFLLFAEERRLLPAEDPLWAESYSVLTLRDDLRVAATRDGEDALERRSSAWHRLLATFRAVHGGVNHDRLTLPAYGGSLFDPDRFPFLEGRRTNERIYVNDLDLGPADDAEPGPGRPIAIDDRTVLAILDSLLTVQVKSGRTKVAQRVSYKALEVEQIGHCYEGLLDHGCAPIDVLALGLTGPEGNEPEITVDELDRYATNGNDDLAEWLSDKTRCGRSSSAIVKDLANEPDGVDLARLRVACGHDDATVERVLPYWGIIRNDLRGLPIVLLPGSQYVTQTSTRRNMGAQYTTKALAEEVVQHALEPIVYDPGPQNEPDQAKWKLKTPEAILDLRVCDPAVGSGAILTAAGRYLANRLIEAVLEHGRGDGRFADRLQAIAVAPAEDQTVLARREVVDHCLYGVDKNPVAAEMAKLSLWLITMARERPFTFLDHAIQVGDSLLGITDIDQLRWLHLDPSARKGAAGFETLVLDSRIKAATDLARQVRELSVTTVRDAVRKQRLDRDLRTAMADLSTISDVIVGAAIVTAGKKKAELAECLHSQLDRIRSALDCDRSDDERAAALGVLDGVAAGWLRTDLPDEVPNPWERRCLHWPIAFPEVFLDGRRRFDAVVGNPPFLGGTDLLPVFGESMRSHLVEAIAEGRRGVRGQADLCVYFLLRLTSVAGTIGILATNSLGDGDSREVGLRALVEEHAWTIYRSVPALKWPGDAQLVISILWLTDQSWQGTFVVGDKQVSSIGDDLLAVSRVRGEPSRLVQPYRQLPGSKVNGRGFVLDADETDRFLASHPKESGVLVPYVSGEDINDSPTHLSSRHIICFWDWPLERARNYPNALAHVERTVRVAREAGGSSGWRERMVRDWWQFEAVRMDLYDQIADLGHVVAIAQTSSTCMPGYVPSGVVFSHAAVVFITNELGDLGVLSSAFHQQWALRYGSAMKTDLRYVASRCFETFPQPHRHGQTWEAVRDAGAQLKEFRSRLMIERSMGLTKTYNRVNDPKDEDQSVRQLRELHVSLDHAVRDAYGWPDLNLAHGHWETPQGVRFTVSPDAKEEILDRLLELNHQRFAEEVAAGLHDTRTKKSSGKGRKKKADDDQQGSLL